MKNTVTLAGEDSGGLSIGEHIPEKDGILANLLILEAMAYNNKTLVELQKELHDFVGVEFKQDRLDYKFANSEILKKVQQKLSLINDYPLMIKEESDLGGHKVTFDDESWVLIRPSGTEPLLRIYIESNEKTLNFLKNFIDRKVKSYFK